MLSAFYISNLLNFGLFSHAFISVLQGYQNNKDYKGMKIGVLVLQAVCR